MTLPKELTTITPVSKFLTLVLLLSLPFVGFFLGLRYERQFTQYLENRVSVDQYKVKTRPSPTLIPSPESTASADTASPDSIGANWKTYIDNNDHYSFKYPSDWDLKEKDSTYQWIRLSPKVNPCDTTLYPNDCEYAQLITISVKDNPKDLSIEEFADPNNSFGMNFKNINVDGVDAKRTSDRPGQFINEDVYIKKGGKIFQITLIKNTAVKEIPIKMFDQILSTFRFTDQ